MKSGRAVREDVLKRLSGDATLNAAAIQVSATDDGSLTLTGTVYSFAERRAAENAAHYVSGVQHVSNELEVVLLPSFENYDTPMARAVLSALGMRPAAP